MNNIDFEHAAEALAGRYEERDKISAMLACLCSAVTSAREALVDAMGRNTEALERVADAADAYRLSRHEGLTVGEFMAGVSFDTDTKSEQVTQHDTVTSYVRLGLDDMGLGFDVRQINDEPAECYGDATAEWHFQSPDELHALAAAFRTRYAAAIDMVATTWAQQIADGTIPAPEA